MRLIASLLLLSTSRASEEATCDNQADYYKKGWGPEDTPVKDCEWVSGKPLTRCLIKDENKLGASYGCGGACGRYLTCPDSDSVDWHKEGEPAKNCAWASQWAPRCTVIGEDGTTAQESCTAACGFTAEEASADGPAGRPCEVKQDPASVFCLETCKDASVPESCPCQGVIYNCPRLRWIENQATATCQPNDFYENFVDPALKDFLYSSIGSDGTVYACLTKEDCAGDPSATKIPFSDVKTLYNALGLGNPWKACEKAPSTGGGSGDMGGSSGQEWWMFEPDENGVVNYWMYRDAECTIPWRSTETGCHPWYNCSLRCGNQAPRRRTHFGSPRFLRAGVLLRVARAGRSRSLKETCWRAAPLKKTRRDRQKEDHPERGQVAQRT